MAAVSDDRNAAPDARPTAAPLQRTGLLLGWLVFLTVACTVIWLLDFSQDVKNVALQATIVLAMLGGSIWAVRSSGLPRRQRWSLAALIVAPLWAVSPLGPVQLVNNGDTGIEGWRWRWGIKPDERLEMINARPTKRIEWRTTPQDYPAFLGGEYWAEVEGVELDPEWSVRPPKPLWRQPIGAGWSGFAIVGDYAITQEQRGESELVVCYEARTGNVVWTHADKARWDPGGGGALGGVGPRATPTVHDARVYTHGATGIVNCLDAATGELLWSHDTLEEYGVENVLWGKAGSPLIVDDKVVISVGGAEKNSLVAFAQHDGKQAWAAGSRRSSYATPVLAELHGVRQILTVDEDAVTGRRADSGQFLWEYPWLGKSDGNASTSQSVPVGENRVLLTKGYGAPAELIEVSHNDGAKWAAEQVWKRPVLRTKMGNVVVRDGFAYGIDDIDLECVEIATGQRQWKKRRRPAFGHGQIILVGDVILVLSESGELVLVEASPKKFNELASLQAIEGVTWNNPAIAG